MELLTNKNNVLKEIYNNLNSISAQIIRVNQSMFLKFESIVNQEMEIINFNFAILDYKNNDFSEIILSLCYKNLISILSAIELIKGGFLGSAKIIFRNIYESLVFGKYIGITQDEKLYNKWKNGEHISINQNIFKKLLIPPSKESIEFWDTLNKYTHSTIYSQNFMLEMDVGEIANCNSIMTTLIAMNYHLLNSFVSKYYDYYLKHYYNPNYSSLKKELNSNLSSLIRLIDPRCKIIIKEYQSKWDVI